MFLGSFKHNLNIKWIKGNKKRKKGAMYHMCKKIKKQILDIPKEMLKIARKDRIIFIHICMYYF